MTNKNNFITHNYLSDYDLISKFNLKSLHQKPVVKNIVIEFPIKNFIKACDLKNISEKDSDIQLKAFLLFYTFTSSIPFINSNKIKIIKNKNIEKDNETNYSIKTILSSNESIYNFLISLFIENATNLIKEDIHLDTFIAKGAYFNRINYKITLPVSSYYELFNILAVSFPELNPKEFFFHTNFKIESTGVNITNNKSFIKNLPLFWING